VLVGKPSTPTPLGLFAIAWAIPWHPTDFLGSWVLEYWLVRTVGANGRPGTPVQVS
jgi:hypothetical protein